MTSTGMHRVRVLTGHLQGWAPSQQQRWINTVATAGATASFHTPIAGAPAGSLPPPLDALQSGPAESDAATRTRDAARALLPWNRRTIDAPTGQVLTHVGEQSARSAKSGAAIPPLFQPYKLGPLQLKNRIVVSPMCTYSADDGFLNDWHLAHLGQFAIGGAALVIVEATAVVPEGRISPLDSGLWKDAQIAPLRRIVALLNSQGTKAGIQLAHAGRKASCFPPFQEPRPPATQPSKTGPELGGWPQAVRGPSALPYADDYHVPHTMSLDDIASFKRSFAASVQRAIKAGFEYIEIHGAHGYLLSSFLSATSNKRTDQYGGSFENRIRLLLEVTRETRAAFSGALGVRFSASEWVEQQDPAGWTNADSVRLVAALAPLGVDLIDVSSGGNNQHQRIPNVPSYQVPFAAEIKAAHPTVTVGAVGNITEPHQANEIVAQGKADLILIAREFLRDPHWPLHAATALGYDQEWSPQYQRAKPSMKSNKTLQREAEERQRGAK